MVLASTPSIVYHSLWPGLSKIPLFVRRIVGIDSDRVFRCNVTLKVNWLTPHAREFYFENLSSFFWYPWFLNHSFSYQLAWWNQPLLLNKLYRYIGGRSVLKHVLTAPTDARFAFDHAFAIKGQGTVLTGAPHEMGWKGGGGGSGGNSLRFPLI